MKWQSESDNLNMNDGHHSSNKSSDAVGKGLYTMLACGMRDFDSKAHQTLDSQHHLLSALDRLTQELDQLLEDAPLPFIMQHAAKISGVRKRVSYLNSLLTSIQHRLDNMDQLLSAQAWTYLVNADAVPFVVVFSGLGELDFHIHLLLFPNGSASYLVGNASAELEFVSSLPFGLGPHLHLVRKNLSVSIRTSMWELNIRGKKKLYPHGYFRMIKEMKETG